MFEATFQKGDILKKAVDAVKDLVNEANMDVQEAGVNMQAMDSSHVSLFTLTLRKEGFSNFRCDRPLTLGLNLGNLQKVLRCASTEDKITVLSDDDAENLQLTFEASERMCDFNLKLMSIDSETLAIPDETYEACICMPSGEFQRIMRDLAVLGDSCTITVIKGSVSFSAEGDVGKGAITLTQSSEVEGEIKPEMEEEQVDDEDKDKKEKKKKEALEKIKTEIVLRKEEGVTSTFALRYLNMFTKATSLSNQVRLHMSPEVPIVVEYPIESYGSISFYLAPKIEEDN